LSKIIDFLSSSSLDSFWLMEKLKCDLEEQEIIRVLLKEYIGGSEAVTVHQLLTTIYTQDEFEFLNKVPLVKRVIDLELVDFIISMDSFPKASQIDILYSQVTPSKKLLAAFEKSQKNSENLKYSSEIEYLNDIFYSINLQYRVTLLRFSYNFKKSELKYSTNNLKLFKKRIEHKLKNSSIDIKSLNYIKKNNLNRKEQTIFFTLLKEEYYPTSLPFRSYSTLIAIISNSNKDLVENRKYLTLDSKLVKNEIINYDEIVTPFGSIDKNFFIPTTILESINSEKKSKNIKTALENEIEKQNIFELLKSNYSLDDVVLNKDTKDMLENLIKQLNPKSIKLLKEWGIKKSSTKIDAKIIFYGSAGTGKTLTATSLAKSMNKEILSLDCSKILSMYVGESEKNVRNIFDTYKDLAKKSKSEPILLLNEADQFLSSRTTSALSSSDKMHNQMQNIFLEQIERFDGLLIATTNLLESIDKAFSRRFNYKVEFKRPTKEQREKIWSIKLPKSAAYSDDFDIKKLIEYDLSGGQIELVIKNCAYNVVTRSNPIFTNDDFIYEINRELKSKFDSDKTLGFLA
jgi:SpoVK/Ycf46/Vps4 family AAA+-type ATPase